MDASPTAGCQAAANWWANVLTGIGLGLWAFNNPGAAFLGLPNPTIGALGAYGLAVGGLLLLGLAALVLGLRLRRVVYPD